MQEGLLFDILRTHERSRYGEDKGFAAIHTRDEFRAALPLTRYDDIEHVR